jgi:hypothetical protein
VLPVITGKTTTRKRSTRPALRRLRHSVRLPMVLMLVPLRFIAATAPTASSRINWVLAHDSGASSVEENTTLGSLESSAIAASSDVLFESDASEAEANPYISR